MATIDISPTDLFMNFDGPQISRDNILHTIYEALESGTELITIDGSQGVGKTVLLKQFTQANAAKSIYSFITAASSWAYDPKFIQDSLYSQIYWMTKGQEPPQNSVTTDSDYRVQLMTLQKRALRGQRFCFVIDGTQGIPAEDARFKSSIFDLLPFGIPGFRFLISTDTDSIPSKARKLKHKTITLSGFSLPETYQYLESFKIDTATANEIFKTCRGNPSNLASVRRLLQSGVAVDALLEDLPGKLPQLFAMEWKYINETDATQAQLLSILAHDGSAKDVSQLALVVGCSSDEVRSRLAHLRFIIIEAETNTVRFVSESFRRFAANRLDGSRKGTLDLLIKYFLNDPQSDKAVSLLPNYLIRAEKYEELLDYMSPELFARSIELSRSAAPIYQKAEYAIHAAKMLKRDGILLGFSLHKSTVQQISNVSLWRSRIEALLALDDYDAAVSLAQDAVLPEDRLHSLAVLARHQKKKSGAVDGAIIDQIKALCQQIEPSLLGSRLMKIASDLMYVSPPLAFKLADMAAQTNQDEQDREWSLAYLSASLFGASALEAAESRSESSNVFDAIVGKIKDPKAKQFSLESASIFGDFSGKQIVAEADRIAETEDKIALLAQWVEENFERNDALKVSKHAIEVAVRAAEYELGARVLAQLAKPLPLVNDISTIHEMISLFDSQKGIAEKTGPAEKFVNFQLTLAHAEAVIGPMHCKARVVEVYYYILALQDLTAKASCSALLFASLPTIDPTHVLEPHDQIHTLAKEEANKCFDTLLESTADHLQATRASITALCLTMPQGAVALALRLNTSYRRDEALLHIVSEMSASAHGFDVAGAANIVDQISVRTYKDAALLNILQGALWSASIPSPEPSTWYPIFERVTQMQDAILRCLACCISHAILSKSAMVGHVAYEKKILASLDSSWEAIDAGWNRVDVGYRIAASLAVNSGECAKKYRDKADAICLEMRIATESAAMSYLYCARLAVRAYGGLLTRRVEREEDSNALAAVIEAVPSCGERANLWSIVALKFHASGRLDSCRKVVAKYVRPLIDLLSPGDERGRSELISSVAPALHAAHSATALETLLQISASDRDRAISNIGKYYLRRTHPSDPYDEVRSQCHGTTYDELRDLCDLINHVERDDRIFYLVRCICDALSHASARSNFTREQISLIASKLGQVVGAKLPSPGHIEHDGFKIVSLASIARLMPTKAGVWIDLVSRARSIGNISDRAYAMTIVASYVPSAESILRASVFDEAEALIAKLPSLWERVTRYNGVAEFAFPIDHDRARRCLRMAASGAVECDQAESKALQRAMMDLAYRIDPKFAEELASCTDGDSARIRARAIMRERLELLNLKKQIAERGYSRDEAKITDKKYAAAAWKTLGALTSGRLGFLDMSSMREAIERASKSPLVHAYPVMSLVLESAVRKYEKTDQATLLLREMFYGAERASRVAEKLVDRSLLSSRKIPANSSVSNSLLKSSSIIVRAGEREKALRWIAQWFEEHVEEYIKICDPYFGPEELQLLQLLHQAVRPCQISILTSKKHQDDQHVSAPYDEYYLRHWRTNVSDQDPPPAEIVVVGMPVTGGLPIHDRWWITKGSGIRVGTSYSSLGGKRDSEIVLLLQGEIEERERDIDQYLSRSRREHESGRISYSLFTL